ncbi:MAG TPA: hypothetical protein VFE88_01355 [Candidatus Nanoarchaeia archaeon]|nr:hypothetical protein [Candidatus Nanoarchaeia archaeon]
MAKKVFKKVRRYRPVRKGRHRKPRPKSFKSEDAVRRWAEARGMKKYTLKNLKNPEAKQKKLVIVRE